MLSTVADVTLGSDLRGEEGVCGGMGVQEDVRIGGAVRRWTLFVGFGALGCLGGIAVGGSGVQMIGIVDDAVGIALEHHDATITGGVNHGGRLLSIFCQTGTPIAIAAAIVPTVRVILQ